MAKTKKNTKFKELQVEVSDSNKVLWLGTASSVSSKNSQGKFDILPDHANFITIIESTPISIRGHKETKEFKFKNALLYNQDNKVKIFADV